MTTSRRKLFKLSGAGVAAAVLIGAAAIAGGLAWRGGIGSDRAAQAEAPPAWPPAVPVSATPAKVQDVPVYFRGLGTVQAVKTVEIRAQVSGTLVAVPVKEGQEVKQGDIVAQIDPRPFKAALDQATAQRTGDTAQLEGAQLDLRRYQTLAKKEFAPVQQVDQQTATVNKLAASVQADTAAIETAQINLGFTTIRSPIDGRISLYQTDAGNLIESANQTNILSITQVKPIEAVFTLPEEEFPRVQRAMAARQLPVLAYTSDGKTKLATGTLLAPNNAIDTTTGTIQLKAIFPNDDEGLWPGEFVNAWLLVDTIRNGVTLPVPAVQHGPNGLFVYVVDPNGIARRQNVEVSYQDGGTAVISNGLRGGENVVLSGQSRLFPGTPVAVQASSGSGSQAPAGSSQ
jgi:membrane fusion protein, multidrug efflux system